MDSHNLYSTSEVFSTYEVSTLPTKQACAQRKLQMHLISRNRKAICHTQSIFPLYQESEAVLIYNSDLETSRFQPVCIYLLSTTVYSAFFKTGEGTKMPRTSFSSGTFSWENHEIQHCLKGLLE